MSALPHQVIDRRDRQSALHTQPFPVLVAYCSAKNLAGIGCRRLRWPPFLHEPQQRMDSCPRNGLPSRRW